MGARNGPHTKPMIRDVSIVIVPCKLPTHGMRGIMVVLTYNPQLSVRLPLQRAYHHVKEHAPMLFAAVDWDEAEVKHLSPAKTEVTYPMVRVLKG